MGSGSILSCCTTSKQAKLLRNMPPRQPETPSTCQGSCMLLGTSAQHCPSQLKTRGTLGQLG